MLGKSLLHPAILAAALPIIILPISRSAFGASPTFQEPAISIKARPLPLPHNFRAVAPDYSLVRLLEPELESTLDMVDYVNALVDAAIRYPFRMATDIIKEALADGTRPIESPSQDEPSITPSCLPMTGNFTPSRRASERDAYLNARYAASAYCPNTTMLYGWMCKRHCVDPGTVGTNVSRIQEDAASLSRWVLLTNPNLRRIVLVFRGSLSLPAIATSIAYFTVPYSSGRANSSHPDRLVHAGFQTAYNTIRDEVRQAVIDLSAEHPSWPVHVVGHSTGGALAAHAALDLLPEFPPKHVHLFTYGAPRIGHVAFAQWVSGLPFGTLTRVVYEADPIPHLPPLSSAYQHFRGELWLQGWWQDRSDGRNPLIPWIQNTAAEVLGFLPSIYSAQDDLCEDASGSNSLYPAINIINHVRAWNVTFGPWC